MVYPWFDIVDGDDIEQGDIFERFQFRVVDDDDPETIHPLERDIIVITQSCDIKEDKVTHLVCCPLYELENYSTNIDRKLAGKDQRNAIIAGRIVHLHMLNQCDLRIERDFRLINFARILEVKKQKLISFSRTCGPRLRLLPPYREHMAQAFARSFMRVGLPADIPKFT